MFRADLIKPTMYRDPAYRAWVRQWPCCVCRTESNIEAAHTGPHGLGNKASDIRVVSLCTAHHRGPYGLDRIGRTKFEEKYNIDLAEQCLWLLNTYLSNGNALAGET